MIKIDNNDKKIKDLKSNLICISPNVNDDNLRSTVPPSVNTALPSSKLEDLERRYTHNSDGLQVGQNAKQPRVGVSQPK